ncbi:hypothetical protein ACGFJC_29425 [Nonomuraea fuscirosea]|uniref:Uncharacterized protein n=1 Tax=Nonomuraea fuscirosea TaxID=1291556 RepID=A0A2T0MZF4_9ACTN|nr:hypothetical protein [Nonomuraea fuscirosea]PRX64772.1 hypothetical protein B0I32_108133 [Nonomuraea fuscirosea]
MNVPNGEDDVLYELRAEVEIELITAEASRPEEEMELPVTDWLFDPTDVEREEIGLRGLIDAVEELEGGHGGQGA